MKAKSSVSVNLEYWAARLILGVFALLPLRFGMWLGSGGARLFSHFAAKLRGTGRRNLELAFPELDESAREVLLQSSFGNLGRLLAVFSHFKKESRAGWTRVISSHGLEQLEAARTRGHGIILFTGHVGAWELSSFGLSLFDQPLSFLVRRIDNPKVERLIDQYRTRRGNRTIDKQLAAREMLQTLQSGGTLGILVDLNTLDREAVFVDYFGVKAATTFVVAKLALRTGAEVFPVFAPWDETQKKFRLEVGPPVTAPQSEDESKNVLQLTQAMTSVVESYVRQYPDQWLWIHRRWKTRPTGEPKIY